MPNPFLRCSIRFAVSIMHGESMPYTAMTEIYFFKKVRELMTFPENNGLSFVLTSKIGRRSCRVKKGFEALFHHDLCLHPSGMIFNRRIKEKYIDEDSIQKHLISIYTYDFLMIDLLSYENSVPVDLQYQ